MNTVGTKDFLKSFCWLSVLQVFVSLIVFSKFISGGAYFAYLDIGSDTVQTFTPNTMHLVRTFQREGFSGWSFEIGLGSVPVLWFSDILTWLSVFVGIDNILNFRIFIYLLKLLLGGWACLLLLSSITNNRTTAVLFSLSYSFCGFIITNGQWDPEATAFIVYPLLLWACVQQLRLDDDFPTWVLPIVVFLSLISGAFFVAVGVFIFLFSIFATLLHRDRTKVAIACISRIYPLSTIGFLLAAPLLLPLSLQLLDTSRVAGGDALLDAVFKSGLTPNNSTVLFAELGGLFHKDIFGIGSSYKGYWNYLEAPGFYIGFFSLLIIPQLWRGGVYDRRLLILGTLAVIFYFVFPLVRYSAMGFAAPYFRISTLWVSITILVMAARGFDLIFDRGTSFKLLVIGIVFWLCILASLSLGHENVQLSIQHLQMVSLFLFSYFLLIILFRFKYLSKRSAILLLFSLSIAEVISIARPSLLYNRQIATKENFTYEDGTESALATIVKNDAGVYRIEKTFTSVTLGESLAQDFKGVKSYSLHSKGVVDFYRNMGLIPTESTVINYTNWLPNMGARFALNSLLGVKYIISKQVINWPGFTMMHWETGSDLLIYRNDFALPMGIVQAKQVSEAEFLSLNKFPSMDSNLYKDLTLINAAVVQTYISEGVPRYQVDDLVMSDQLNFDDLYVKPVSALKDSGLQLTKFSSDHITGRIDSALPGILVFSIPFNQGWELRVDGVKQEMQRTNFGMLGSPVTAGPHSIELTFSLPGLQLGIFLSLLGVFILVFWQRGRHFRALLTERFSQKANGALN